MAHGKLRDVVVRAAGDPVAGLLSRSRTAWHSEGLLNPSHSYTVTATAIGAGAKRVTATSTFQTLKPRKTFSASIIEGYQQSYGVGMPIVLTFNRPITHKAAVESSLSLVTSKPVVGAWYWDGNETLEFRPRVYWPQHTVVSVKGDFKGVEAAPRRLRHPQREPDVQHRGVADRRGEHDLALHAGVLQAQALR